MPEIAATPSPVIASTNGANSASTTSNSDSLAGATDTSSAAADPFSSMLQRLIKGQSGQDQSGLENAQLALLMEGAQAQDAALTAGIAQDATLSAATTGQDVMANLMSTLQAQVMGLQPLKDGTSATENKLDDGKDDKKKDDLLTDDNEDPLAAFTNMLVAANGIQSNKSADTSGSGEQGAENGNSALDLAAKPAILAQATEAEVGQAVSKQSGEETLDFQSLLDNAHTVQTAQSRPVNAHNELPQTLTKTEAQVQTPVGHPQWGQEVGDKVVWMVGKQENRAELVLNPPQMGRIEVSITMNGDQASASFNSTNPAVREALESALPRLREVLADAGVRLDQAQVGSDTRGDSPQQQERRDNSGRNNIVANGEVVPGLASTSITPSTSQWVKQGNGMVDTFA